jgi:hypothetical protein
MMTACATPAVPDSAAADGLKTNEVGKPASDGSSITSYGLFPIPDAPWNCPVSVSVSASEYVALLVSVNEADACPEVDGVTVSVCGENPPPDSDRIADMETVPLVYTFP